MRAPAQPAPIIIRKKKAGGHGHHGGAWKVAYADFVTAMMALFIVLWLLSSSENVKKSVAGYFQDPTGNGKSMGSDQAGAGAALHMSRADMEKLKQKIEAAFKKVPDFQAALKDKVQMSVTGDGLRIEFLENEKGVFFQSGSPAPTKDGKDLLAALAKEVGRIPAGILIEGHTDSRPFSGEAGYSNWELSADRANAARRLMESSGLKEHQVSQVRGYAAERLRDPKDPASASNRRISIVVQYAENTPAAPGAKAASEAHEPPKASETPSRHS